MLLLTLALPLTGACTSNSIPSISPTEALALKSAGKAVIIDVREAAEIKEGMVADAKWLPLSGLKEGSASVKQSLDALDKNQELLLYCRSGTRSGKAALLLREKGFKVRNLGGFSDLKSAGYPVIIP